jgi:hypothetical protein
MIQIAAQKAARPTVPTRRIFLQRVEEAVERLLESPLLLHARQAS